MLWHSSPFHSREEHPCLCPCHFLSVVVCCHFLPVDQKRGDAPGSPSAPLCCPCSLDMFNVLILLILCSFMCLEGFFQKEQAGGGQSKEADPTASPPPAAPGGCNWPPGGAVEPQGLGTEEASSGTLRSEVPSPGPGRVPHTQARRPNLRRSSGQF